MYISSDITGYTLSGTPKSFPGVSLYTSSEIVGYTRSGTPKSFPGEPLYISSDIAGYTRSGGPPSPIVCGFGNFPFNTLSRPTLEASFKILSAFPRLRPFIACFNLVVSKEYTLPIIL